MDLRSAGYQVSVPIRDPEGRSDDASTGMSRPVWRGTISFGLVSVPVKAYTAARDHTVHFNQLDRDTGSRVRHLNVSEQTGDEVERDDIVLGYEVSDGEYVTFERDELDELRPKSTKAIEVRDFVDLDEVDPIYYQRTYWLGPDGDGREEPYSLLLARDGGPVAGRHRQRRHAQQAVPGRRPSARRCARHVDDALRRRGHRPLHHRADPEEGRQGRHEGAEARRADRRLAHRRLGPEQYHDTYVEEVQEIIEAKAEGETADRRRARRARRAARCST